MRVDVYLPLALAGIFGVAGPSLARRLPPALATWLLSIGGLVCATASTAALIFLGWTLVGQTPDVAARGHWSTTALRANDPVATPVAIGALVVLGVVTAMAVTALARRTSALVAAHRLAATLPTQGGQLVVIDDDSLPACAIPGRPGRIVTSTALLRRLDSDERRAVLAHERSHLVHHHHLHHTAAQLAAAASPVLAGLPRALALATERWADEDAADRTHRGTVARALQRTATIAHPPRPTVVLGAAVNHLTARVTALAAPPPRPVKWRILTLTATVAAATLATLEAADDVEGLFELAVHAYRAGHGQP